MAQCVPARTAMPFLSSTVEMSCAWAAPSSVARNLFGADVVMKASDSSTARTFEGPRSALALPGLAIVGAHALSALRSGGALAWTETVRLALLVLAAPMLAGMLVMALAFWAYCIAVSLARLRVVILEREQHTQWVRAELGAPR